jgi:hypothetical protein
MGFKEKSTGYMEQAFLVLLGLWLKVYRKLQNKPDSEAETLASSSMSFTYHPIPRRAVVNKITLKALCSKGLGF